MGWVGLQIFFDLNQNFEWVELVTRAIRESSQPNPLFSNRVVELFFLII